jgi:pseudaminic acid biosynthesis-associated methylase
MSDITDDNSIQRNFWSGDFAEEYIQRNSSIEGVNDTLTNLISTTFEDIVLDFLSSIDKNSKILEVGCNIGLRLKTLSKLGFTNLTGLEINDKAIKIAKQENPEINFIHSSIEEYVHQGSAFDLVFTSDVLIHINPNILDSVISKIVSLSKRYIFGFEYYSDSLTEIKYRNNSNVLWKQNFPKLYLNRFSNLKSIKQQKFPHKNSELCDVAYLLIKY